ncbi:MAG: adenylate/guanylate cyclase domain-containing protein [Alphaproteobacteria bacterium]|nr:adenylate/guanylate cyclase domain-containing protein [Alphaproteobacteria bacterium]
MTITRKLAAILYADVAGYSRLTGADEEGTHRILDAYLDVFTASIKSHDGRVVHYAGDAVLAEFTSVVAALTSAAAVQRELEARNRDHPDDRKLRFRIGINLGEVIVDRDDIYGDGVNIAARLEGLAEPGGICISGSVHDQVKGKVDLAFEDLGEQTVKNIAVPVRVWRWLPDSPAASPGTGVSTEPLTLPDKPSIAVLPFANLSGDPEQEYFADGIAEDIITALSNVQSFFVIARHSSFTYKGKAVDMKRVGRELGVHYVLEGSVRKSGNRVRVTAQLIEAASGNHIWADRYDGALDDIFDLQDEIAASVVGAIEPQLLRVEVERIRHKRPDSFDAYDYTLCGLAHMNKLSPEETDVGLGLFLKAIEVDPNYARAYACASWFYRRQVQLRGMVLSDEDKAEGIRLAQAGLKADSTDPYVLWQAGMTVLLVEGDFDAAVLYIDRSLSINANSTRAWLSSASVRCCVGDPETAIEHADRAIRLSPLDIAMWVAHGVLATAHLQLADYEEAAAWARKSVRQHVYNAPAYHVLAACCAHLGRTEAAGAAVARSLELDPAMTIPRLKAIYPVSGYRNLDGFLEGLRKAGLPAPS